MTTISVSRSIADWSCGSIIESLPSQGWALARRAVLDTLAVSLLGSRLEAPRIVAQVEQQRGGVPVASVFGMGRKADLMSAALVNGTAAHADLFDDNSAPMIAHPSSPLVSCLLPLAQSRQLGGGAVLQSYAVGFEVGVRLGRLLNPALYEQGWHATRVLGLIGSTAACCRLIGLDATRTASALGIAVSMASGLRQNFGTMTMAFHVGLTARDAIHCALLAEAGMASDARSLEGSYGLFKAFSGRALQSVDLGHPFELLTSGIIFKPYPSGAPTHAAVDAALALRNDLGGAVDEIAQIDCRVHPWNAMTLREEEPLDALQAKVNMRYCIAAAMLHGELGFRQFTDEKVQDPTIRALMKKIVICVGDDLPDNAEFPAQLELRTLGGRIFKQRREVPPGGSTRPLSSGQIEAKFRSCSERVLDGRQAGWVIEAVNRLESISNVGQLCEILEGRVPADASEMPCQGG
jgi:2-methylcitrate dehydratase PrpD